MPHFAHGHLAKAAIAAKSPVSIKSSILEGTATGDYAITPNPSSVGAKYALNGDGAFDRLGSFHVTGSIQTATVKGKLVRTGTITLTSSIGTIRLTILPNSGPQPLSPVSSGTTAVKSLSPMVMKYTIAGGTGAFKNFRGAGTVNLALAPSTVSVPPTTLPPTTLPPTSLPPTTPPPTTVPPPTSLPPTTPPPTTVPPTTLPPTTLPPTHVPPKHLPPRSLPPSKLPPTNPPGRSFIGTPVGVGGQTIMSEALKPVPLGGPTFLTGKFTLTFNKGFSTLPPRL
jgi:hypothetical protein